MVILSEKNSIANHFIAEMRSAQIQKDSMRFRRNMERLGEIMAYEISQSFVYEKEDVLTPLGTSSIPVLKNQPVLACVLRAGLPFYQGFLNFFDKAESSFIAAYRAPHKEDYSFDIDMEYITSPSLENKVVILIDPMLATGKSLLASYHALLRYGKPQKLHIVSIIASKPGIEYLSGKLPDVSFWIGAVDKELNKKAYIVPGLGDAGDLSFGAKL